LRKYLLNKRYLVSFDVSALPVERTEVLVIGSGVAGLRAAIEASRFAPVLMLTKDRTSESNSNYAQGGIAAALSEGDSAEAHIGDTLLAGAGLCDEETVANVVRNGPSLVQELIDWGAAFDSDDSGYLFTQEGGHSRPRILHAHGDATGYEIVRALSEKANSIENIRILEHAFVIDVITDDGRAAGVIAHCGDTLKAFLAPSVIIATGGACYIYRETTNPRTATGDGIAMAYRAGATLTDLEFVQFHPTTLYIAGAERALISETVRGEGGMLRDRFGVHFMPNYHPLGDLAPRDVVSRGIVRQMSETRDTNVYLDLRHLDKQKILRRFPKLAELCALFDIDIAADMIPVRPSAHYFCGGVEVDEVGFTGVEGLYACGEAAGTGLHGANRLGSNSLLEGLVFGRAAGEAAGRFAASAPAPAAAIAARTDAENEAPSIDILDMENSLRSLMWRQVGITRAAAPLAESEERVDFWASYIMDKEFAVPEGWVVQNMLTLAKLITYSARMRTESRGAHHRLDFPDRDDYNWARHLVMKRE
jgi:L-aspartate oxidase